MEDPVKKVSKLEILSYIDDFIQNNVKVLENPRYTDIGEYHKLMKRIKSKQIYSQESCGTIPLKRSNTEESVKDYNTNIVNNSLQDVSCTSDSSSKDTDLSNKEKAVVSSDINESILIKQELPEIKTEIFEFNPDEHGICITENYSDEFVKIKSDSSHNVLYELHNDNNLLQFINNDNEAELGSTTVTFHESLNKNGLNNTLDCENDSVNISQIKKEVEDTEPSDCESNIYEYSEIKCDVSDNSLIKNEPTQLEVQTDLVEQLQLEKISFKEIVKKENNTDVIFESNMCELNKKRSTVSKKKSKKQQYALKNKVLHQKKYSIFLKSTLTNKHKIRKYKRCYTYKPKKPTKLMKKESTEKHEEEITIKNCSVSLVKVEDELLNSCKLKPDSLLKDRDTPLFYKQLLHDMMNTSSGKQLIFFSPENLNILLDKLNQGNLNSNEIILFLNTNDVVTEMYMDHFPQFKTAVLENTVKIIDKTVAEVYTRFQGINIIFDTYVPQKLNALAIKKRFGHFKKRLTDLK